jgi:hypothetical protein
MEKEMLMAKLVEIGSGKSANPTLELAELANAPYDAELPVPEVISAVFKVASIERGAEYDYFTIVPTVKTVQTVVDGAVTQTNVVPRSHNTLAFSSYESEEDYVYLSALLEAKYDVVSSAGEDHMEALNRLEVKAVCDLLIAGAVSASNVFTLESGDTAVKFAKLVEMVRSIQKYGKKVIAIAGANAYTDLVLMDSTEDKNREVTPAMAGISQVISVEALTFVKSGTQTVLDADTLILVAVSDSKGNAPGHFVRRKVRSLDGASDKERVIISAGPLMNVGTNRKSAYATWAFEQFGAVLVNKYTVATLSIA